MHSILYMSHASVIFLCHVGVAVMSRKAHNWMRAHFHKGYKAFPCTLSQFECYAWQEIQTIIRQRAVCK